MAVDPVRTSITQFEQQDLAAIWLAITSGTLIPARQGFIRTIYPSAIPTDASVIQIALPVIAGISTYVAKIISAQVGVTTNATIRDRNAHIGVRNADGNLTHFQGNDLFFQQASEIFTHDWQLGGQDITEVVDTSDSVTRIVYGVGEMWLNNTDLFEFHLNNFVSGVGGDAWNNAPVIFVKVLIYPLT